MFEKLFDTVIENMLGRMTLEEKAYALTPLDNQYCSIPSQDFYGPTPQDVPGGGQDNWPAGKPVRERMADLRMESIILLLFRPILLWQ